MAIGSSARYGEDDEQMIVDINVTPLVDVALVLLIIFMVATPRIIQSALHVQLPRAQTGEEAQKTTLAIELSRDGTLMLNGARATEDEVKAHILRTLPGTPDLQAVIAADRAVAYDHVVRIIDLVRQNGVHKFALSIESSKRDR